MGNLPSKTGEEAGRDLLDFVEHSHAVSPTQTVSAVYEFFQSVPHDFVAVAEAGEVVGTVSRGHIGFLLGSRFGFAIFGRQAVSQHLLERSLTIRRGTPLLAVFEAALSRQGESFYDDVVLLDEQQHYLGMIPVQMLVRMQTQMITEQIRLAEKQQAELQEKNQQLFRNVHELRQSRGRYEILFENSALGVMLLDRQGVVETINQRLERLLGIADSAVSRRLVLPELVQPLERGRFLELLGQLEMLPAAAAPSGGEFTLSLPTRGPRLFKFFLSWIKETGQICALLDDITEQRVLERRMQQKEKSALLESLVGGIAHEINNKLSPIVGFADLLFSEVGQLQHASDLENYCLIIRDSALESAKIIRQLLQLSRPHKVEMARCDLKQIVQDVVNLLRFRFRALECQVEVNLPTSECALMGDAAQLKQVVINLVLNAADAMEGRSPRQLGLRVVPGGKHFHLLVSDTGYGIKPEHVGRIFDPFFTTKTPDRGTGLGLSVCFSVVKQHNGEITVAETSERGTTFKVTLPCGDVVPLPATVRRLLAPGSNNFLRACRVLIADDEEFVGGLVQETLRLKIGCQVDKAMDGSQAIEQIGRNAYDLVISDVRMPTLDGFGLLEWIKANQPALVPRFVFITGDAGSAELNDRLETADLTVLRKPFDVETLLRVCRQKLNCPLLSPAPATNSQPAPAWS